MPNQQPYNYNYNPGSAPAAKKKSSSTTLIVVLACVAVGLFICCGILAFLLLPAISAGRNAAGQMSDSNNIRQIGAALKQYEATYQQLPPAYTVDATGRKLHSWRTLILPYLEQKALYDSIDLTKPWDAPENAKAYATNVPIFSGHVVQLPSGQTLYRAVVHPNGVFTGSDGTKLSTITDGGTRTIMIVQAGKDQGTHWMQPENYSLSDFQSINSTNTPYILGKTHAVFADASVKLLDVEGLGPKGLEDLVIINNTASATQP